LVILLTRGNPAKLRLKDNKKGCTLIALRNDVNRERIGRVFRRGEGEMGRQGEGETKSLRDEENKRLIP
jgi:hypothetical protein